jgi:hypothetical protein
MTNITAATSLVFAPTQRPAYGKQGILMVCGGFTPDEITAAGAEANRLVKRKDRIDIRNLRCRWEPYYNDSAYMFETLDPVINIALVCALFAHHSRLLAILGAWYGEPTRLFKDKLIFKPRETRGYDLYQDYIASITLPGRPARRVPHDMVPDSFCAAGLCCRGPGRRLAAMARPQT